MKITFTRIAGSSQLGEKQKFSHKRFFYSAQVCVSLQKFFFLSPQSENLAGCTRHQPASKRALSRCTCNLSRANMANNEFCFAIKWILFSASLLDSNRECNSLWFAHVEVGQTRVKREWKNRILLCLQLCGARLAWEKLLRSQRAKHADAPRPIIWLN